jgi:hypothetical protein
MGINYSSKLKHMSVLYYKNMIEDVTNFYQKKEVGEGVQCSRVESSHIFLGKK